MHQSCTCLYRLVKPYARRLEEPDAVQERAASSAVQQMLAMRYAPSGLLAYLKDPRHQLEDIRPQPHRPGSGLSDAA
jgi:hypothetical protein